MTDREAIVSPAAPCPRAALDHVRCWPDEDLLSDRPVL